MIEKEIYLQRKQSVLEEMKVMEEEMADHDDQEDFIGRKVTEKLELLKSLYLSYTMGTNDKKGRSSKNCARTAKSGKKMCL